MIRGGIASVHLMRSKTTVFGPHVHAVIITEPGFHTQTLIEAWKKLGKGYADVEPIRSLGRSVRYTIAGKTPETPDGKREVSSFLHGVRLVRHMGK